MFCGQCKREVSQRDNFCSNCGESLNSVYSNNSYLPELEDEFKQLQFSGQGMQKLLTSYDFETVLDIGSGAGHHTDLFIKHDKQVTALDYGKSIYFEKQKNIQKLQTIVANFNDYSFEQQFDCIWCSHILEHQLNPHNFLRKVHDLIVPDGVLAITVPPHKNTIVGGHVTLWNAGILLYQLVLAGFDCRSASILRYGYNISIILHKKSIDVLGEVAYDSGDIRRLKNYFPTGLNYYHKPNDDPFDGDIFELNWLDN
ncbi:MAG: methyltransferase domain-containing protein [Paraglaciecola sp.]|uniref:methyltransferase domain-containing protein n=1 Tax=Paraglaciecola sp. TaxID=1920173 RepID=UPI00329A169D